MENGLTGCAGHRSDPRSRQAIAGRLMEAGADVAISYKVRDEGKD
jgi:hypothetical protein